MLNMLNWCKERFEDTCNRLVIVSLILFPAFGAFEGYWIAQLLLLLDHDLEAVHIFLSIIGILIGIIVGLGSAIIYDILVYGFIAVVIDMKETLHAINNHCDSDTQSIDSHNCENYAQETPKQDDNNENGAQKIPDDTDDTDDIFQKIIKANAALIKANDAMEEELSQNNKRRKSKY